MLIHDITRLTVLLTFMVVSALAGTAVYDTGGMAKIAYI